MKHPRVHAPDHLAFVRTLPCLVCADNISSEAAHIRYADDRFEKPYTGKSEKPDDKWTVPLCNRDHYKQHTMNEREYWDLAGIDPILVARDLYACTGNYADGCAIIGSARA
jgi:hypothetical protein